ncbi:tripartite tricarboxylate transporter substrate binding protein [Roseococcus sp. SYP-B2431]|uniref:Bug family tripartite tricarboxylate transporter substrate binding protein n=1 Tax=Roseococcus sp. SYP-B2431 TaxID=2496640 RepID=UPI00103BA99F|nr:tripartite tricarboxylate transporter substrate binding protein [Roseococcus sp. SYP-B2431]TCH98336.1 tripartite tricarboxylate transporter substrate binding protein [Roseococcus sp. SYP-B2431]
MSISQIARRRVLAAPAALALAAESSSSAFAQTPGFPSRPIRIVAPGSGGSWSDLICRVVGEHMQVSLGNPVIVDNRPGAQGVIAAGEVARGAKDGHVIGYAITSAQVLAPLMIPRLPYRNEDFQSITTIFRGAMALAVPATLPVRNVAEFVAHVRSQGGLSYGSNGVATSSHLLMEMFQATANIALQNVVYRDESAATMDLLAGNVPSVVTGLTPLHQFHKEGKIRIIGISSEERLEGAPDIATFREQGFPDLVYTWFHGFVSPSGVPRPVIDRLRGVILEAMETQRFRDRMTPDLIVRSSTPEEFTAEVLRDQERLGAIIRERNIRPAG